MLMIKFQSKLTSIKSIQGQTCIWTDTKLVRIRLKTMSQYLEREQSSKALLMKICRIEDPRRASGLIRETCQCLSQLMASKSISGSTASLTICRRSITSLTIIDLSFERKHYSDLHYEWILSLILNFKCSFRAVSIILFSYSLVLFIILFYLLI